jgi:hypothetical protein
MYAITYTLSSGTVLHRSRSAADAIEAMELLQSGGGVVLKIVVTRTGKEISVAELQLLARREQSADAQTQQQTGPRFPWHRRRKT